MRMTQEQKHELADIMTALGGIAQRLKTLSASVQGATETQVSADGALLPHEVLQQEGQQCALSYQALDELLADQTEQKGG